LEIGKKEKNNLEKLVMPLCVGMNLPNGDLCYKQRQLGTKYVFKEKF
jgi:hypothetical protein